MPEGHTVHRNARAMAAAFRGGPVHLTSPQGRFSAGAALLDGRVMTRAQAYGKHLLLGFEGSSWLHVHLGLYGTWTLGEGEAPEPRGAVRVRLEAPGAWADLRGPTACEVLSPAERTALVARLGPDPLRPDADPDVAARVLLGSRAPVGALLMRQDVVAGVGNVYRAEVLFRAGVDPWLPGRALDPSTWTLLWQDLVVLMRGGLRRGRIVTTDPEHRSRRRGAVLREDAHYVYRRDGLPCRVCGTAVVMEEMVARRLYRCPTCQPA